MAWALEFDGVNDYLTFPTPVGTGTGVSGDDNQHWELVITQDLLEASTYVYRPIESSTVSRVEVLFRVSDGLVRFVSPISGQYEWTGTGINSDVNQEIKFIKPVGVRRLDLYVNGVFFASDTGGENSCSFDVYGVNSGAGYVSGNLTQLKFTDFITSANDRDFDPTASSHASGTPVLTDTIGANNATGVNMPTDGSAWIDLGGGGGGLTLVVSSIDSLEAFGTPNIRRAQEILAVESILSLEAFGTPSLTIISTIAIPSIESEEAFGLPTVELTSVFVVVDSILTEEEFGTPTIIVGETFVLPVSIVSAEAFGTPNVTSIGIVTQYLTVATIFSEEEFGVPDVSLFDKHLLVVSIQSGEEFGKPKILGGVQVTNTLNIPEVTLNQISDANHAINIVGNDIGNARRSVYQSAVVRVIDHDDDDATAVDDPTRMALFESKAHGQPWNKYKGHGEHSIHSGSVIETDTNMNQIFPTFEYNEFE